MVTKNIDSDEIVYGDMAFFGERLPWTTLRKIMDGDDKEKG